MSYRCSCCLLPLRVCQESFAAAISRTVANILTTLEEPLEETFAKSLLKLLVNSPHILRSTFMQDIVRLREPQNITDILHTVEVCHIFTEKLFMGPPFSLRCLCTL